MAERRPAMGRGLAALLSTSGQTAAQLGQPVGGAPQGGGDAAGELRLVGVLDIVANPHQPRRDFDEEALLALADSLRERGILQPVLVRPRVEEGGPRYELVAGERRWRAAQLAGFTEVPAIVRPHDDAESIELALIENMARQDLNPVEEARACALLVDELGLSREEIGRRVGRSRVAVSNLMRLLDLPDDTLDLIAAGSLSEGHGRALLLAPDHDERRRLGRAAVSGTWTVRRTEDAARGGRPVGETTPRRARGAAAEVHPDQAVAAERLEELYRRKLGHEVHVKPHGDGFRLTLEFGSLQEAEAGADRLRGGSTAPP